jgi:hypothetical protein
VAKGIPEEYLKAENIGQVIDIAMEMSYAPRF